MLMDNSNLYQWQETVLEEIQKQSRLGGRKKDKVIIFNAGRQTGKSHYVQRYMQYMTTQKIQITGSYTDWKETWIWPWNRKVSIYGKKIWGRIKTRYCRLSINGDGTSPTQYATDKEVFKKQLKDGVGW